MKHKLLQTWARKSAKLLAAIALLATTAFGAKADYTCLFGKSYNSENVNNYKNSWYTTNDGFRCDLTNWNNNNNEWAYVRCGSKSAASTATITTNAAIRENIQSVTVTIDAITADKITSIKLYTSPDGKNYTEAGSFSKAKGDQEVSLTNSNANSYYKIEFVCLKGKSNGLAQVSKVVYKTGTVDPDKPAAPTFTPDGGEVDFNSTVTITRDDKALSLKYWFGDDETAATTVKEASATVTITGACTLNAIAIGEGDAVSATKTASFTINPASYPNTIYYNHCTSDDCGFEAWGVAGVTNPWTIDATYGLKATGYKNGANNETEGVMSSPVLDLTNRANITLDFDQAINMFKNGKTVLSGEDMDQINNYISVVIAEVEDETIPTDWTKLADATLPESQSWNFYAQNPAINLDAYKGKKVRIGFKYTSTTEMAGTWEIKNVLVRGDIAPELPAPTAEDGVEVDVVDGGWGIRPEKYPVTLTFAVEDGVQIYAKKLTAAQAAAEDNNDGYTALPDNKLTLTKSGEEYSVYAMKDGVKSEAKTITANVPSGIAGIEAENGEAVYFNLQGVRVENPENGIFIRVQNGKAVKIAK